MLIIALGNIRGFNTYLFNVYECDRPDTSGDTILTDNPSKFDNCSETWGIMSAIYFMFVTVSTVGYGDFTPKTVLGRATICIFIMIGIYKYVLRVLVCLEYLSNIRPTSVE